MLILAWLVTILFENIVNLIPAEFSWSWVSFSQHYYYIVIVVLN